MVLPLCLKKKQEDKMASVSSQVRPLNIRVVISGEVHVVTRYFDKISNPKTWQPPNDVRVVLIKFWNEEIRELVLWDRKVKDKFIRSLAKEVVFSRIEAAVDRNCD